MMGDGRALQSGTSHNLGQNFAKAFDIQYLDHNNTLQYVWTTSWGVSTRFIGAIIMVHGDDQGLILPPRLAPYQTVIVPIFKNDDEKSAVLEVTERVRQELIDAGIRLKVDDRENLSPGFKFNDWELRGVPTRIEIGPKDVAKNSVALARRDRPGREGKQFVSQEGLVNTVQGLLEEVQEALLERARRFRDENTHDVDNYDDFKKVVKADFARVWWAGSDDDEQRVQEETKATLRCFPLEQPEGTGTCFYTGQPADKVAIFARAY
jgi:prolyl-tRNA synthetase